MSYTITTGVGDDVLRKCVVLMVGILRLTFLVLLCLKDAHTRNGTLLSNAAVIVVVDDVATMYLLPK